MPGCVAGWAALHEKLGKLPFADVLAPAIDYAERGFAISPMVRQKWAAQADVLQPQPGFAEHFLPRGRAPHIGEHFVLKAAAAALKPVSYTHLDVYKRQCPTSAEVGASISRMPGPPLGPS